VESDADGNLYVIDSAQRKLQKFDQAGNSLASVDIREDPANGAEQAQPWGLGIAPTGEIVVADTFGWRLRVFDKDLKPLRTIGTIPDTSRAPGPFELFGPRDAAVDAQGQVWVTDTGHDRIQVFTLGGDFVKSIGSEGNGQLQFNEPVGIDIGPDGAIYIADMYNRRVQILNSDGTYRSEFQVDGWGGQEVNDKPYLRVLKDGRVALGLPAANQVRIYSAQGTNPVTVASGSEPMDTPYGIVETADAKLWVVESGKARLRQFAIP
jgi:DNA-binding beta-propeller fold protein YncE